MDLGVFSLIWFSWQHNTVLLAHFNLFTEQDVNTEDDGVVASLHHRKLHTCQHWATGAKKKNDLFFSWILRM